MRVAHRAGDSAGLVEGNVVITRRGLDLTAVEDDLVDGEVDLRP
jgi:hypothetical protein